MEEIEHKLNTYDSTYSDADECTISKEELERKLKHLKSEQKRLEKI